MNYWTTSDFHFGHTNIIKYCDRPFKDVDEMNDVIIRKFNERVKPEDIVFFLGDFCFKSGSKRGEGESIKPVEYQRKLNGNIIYIKGNHDRNNSLKSIIRHVKIQFGSYLINLVHRPEDIKWDCDFNIVGHVHENWKTKIVQKVNYLNMNEADKMLLINCGVDVWNFYPAKLTEIVDLYNKEKVLIDRGRI